MRSFFQTIDVVTWRSHSFIFFYIFYLMEWHDIIYQDHTMSLQELTSSSFEKSLYSKQTCISSLSPHASSTTIHVRDIYENLVFYHLILDFEIISVIIDENGGASIELQQKAKPSSQFFTEKDPMNGVPHALRLKETSTNSVSIGHLCVSVYDVDSYYQTLSSTYDNNSVFDTTNMNDKLEKMNKDFFLNHKKVSSYEYNLEYYTRLNDENSKPGIFFLKGPGEVPIEIYKYAHRKNSLVKDKEVEIVEDLGIKFNHSMVDFKLTSGDKCLMTDVLAFYVNVLGMRVLDVKHNKNDKFSLYFMGFLPNDGSTENWWVEDKNKMYLPRRAREGYLQLRYYWSADGYVSKKPESLGYSFEISVDSTTDYLKDVSSKYNNVYVDFENKTVKDPTGNIFFVKENQK